MTAPEVLLEDQERINAFGKLNNRKHWIEAELKAKKKLAEDLEDASNELLVTDEEESRYACGDVFVRFENDTCEERLQAAAEDNTEEVGKMQADLEEILAEMAQLKTLLYKKFGSAINLED
mmetsp:Transcript_14085/g.46273  ORF Transcript_14085/g.46273 Transcript_14085/m.46273 type:complete len:121 (+) Transcript_14085:103-465(+)